MTPIKWHGGKSYLATRIIALMPPHTFYVEPFAGGLSVLLSKNPEGVSEVANDLDGDLTTFWRVLRNPESFNQLYRMAVFTPFSEREWVDSAEGSDDQGDEVIRAWRFFVRCRQSLAGRRNSFAPLSRARTRRGMNEQASAWLSAIDGLPEVHQRLQRVVILSRPAAVVIRSYDWSETLFYCDPPYLPETRKTPDVYAHEMTLREHAELLELLKVCKGKVLLSGYPNLLYNEMLADWYRVDFEVPNHAASGLTKRRMTECLWCNFKPASGES